MNPLEMAAKVNELIFMMDECGFTAKLGSIAEDEYSNASEQYKARKAEEIIDELRKELRP